MNQNFTDKIELDIDSDLSYADSIPEEIPHNKVRPSQRRKRISKKRKTRIGILSKHF